LVKGSAPAPQRTRARANWPKRRETV